MEPDDPPPMRPIPRRRASGGYRFAILHLGTFLFLVGLSPDRLDAAFGIPGGVALSMIEWVLVGMPCAGLIGLAWSSLDRARGLRLAAAGMALNASAILCGLAAWIWLRGGVD